MKILKPLFVSLFIFLFFLPAHSLLAEPSGILPPFVSGDRVLILAPHPDDETLAAGGVLQAAVKAGAKVKVVLLTHGENNLLAFMVYDKRFFFGPKRILRMGAMRKQETVKAMKQLGMSEKDVISLGYPDSGTLEIMTKRWGKAKPFRGKFSRARQVPYSDARSPGAPYLGESILKDIEQILSDYVPTKIFVSHPADKNRDHRALYLFLRVALWDLDGKISPPAIYPYLVHIAGWPKPALELTPPPDLAKSEIAWQNRVLAPGEITRKSKALQDYPSQIKYAPKFLISFARRNEFFGDYPVLKIREGEKNQSRYKRALSYAAEGDDLVVRLTLRRRINKRLGISIWLLPYQKNVLFSSMPKVKIKTGLRGLRAKDQSRNKALKGIRFTSRGKALEFRIPLALLGNPDFILVSGKTALNDLTLDEMAWRVLSLD